MAGIVEAAVALLAKVAAQPVIDAAKRQEYVIAALHKLHLDPKVPPADFPSLYAYSLVNHCYAKRSSVLNIFRDQYVRDAFERSFVTGESTHLRKEIEEALQRNSETHEFGEFADWVLDEVGPFTEVFNRLVDKSRPAAGARIELKIDQISLALNRLERTQVNEEISRQERSQERAAASPAERLGIDISEWFQAVGYKIERKVATVEDRFVLILKVPVRRGRFDRVVAYGVGGELSASHVEAIKEIVAEEHAAEGWGIAPRRVSKAAREAAADSNGSVVCYTFDELIDEDADFEPYILWLEDETRKRKIDERYVRLSCSKSEHDENGNKIADSIYGHSEGGLDSYVSSWLEDPSKEHLSILGEFGTGKTWFTLHFAWQVAKLWREAKTRGAPRPRLPLVIPLRDYAKAVSVESLFSEFFFRKHEIIPGGYSVFQQLNRMGRLLLIFDGFDEMAAKVDRQAMVSNFWELASVAVPGAKVLLSCRTEHFPDDRSGRDLLAAKVDDAANASNAEGPTFEVVELRPLDDVQVEMMLSHLTNDATIRSIMGDDRLLDLMRRPVMSELVLDALPEIEAGARIDLAKIYLYAVRRKLERDIRAERTFTSPADKFFFMCELSWEMLSTERLSINYRDFPSHLRACFGLAVQETKDLDYWHHDMRSQTMLIRNAQGDYSPAHKSLVEFFVALRLAAQLGVLRGEYLGVFGPVEDARKFRWSEYFAARRTDEAIPAVQTFVAESTDDLLASVGFQFPTEPTCEFLASILAEDTSNREAVLDLIRDTRSQSSDDRRVLGSVLLGLLTKAGFPLRNIDIEGANLNGLNCVQHLRVVDLAGANLRGIKARRGTLDHIRLTGADLREAVLHGNEVGKSTPARAAGFLPSGYVVSHIGNEVIRWNGTLPDGEGTLVYTLSGDGWVQPDNDLERIYVYQDNRTLVFDSAEPNQAAEIPGVLQPMQGWGGPVLVMLDGPRHNANFCILFDKLSLRELNRVALPDGSGAGFIVQSTKWGICFYDHETERVFRLAGRERLQWIPEGGGGIGQVDSLRRSARRGSTRWMFRPDRIFVFLEYDAEDAKFFSLSYDGKLEWLCPTPVGGYTNNARFLEGQRIVVAVGDRGVSAWQMDGSELLWSRRVTRGVNSVDASRDGSTICVGSDGGELLLLSSLTGEVIYKRHFGDSVLGARFSANCGLEAHVLDSLELGGAVVD